MMFGNYRNFSTPLPASGLLLLAGIYLLAGIIGHDPWKSDDAIHIGVAYGFATQGHWLFPQVAGESWIHSPPLYHWVAALLGKLLEGWVDFHNAARLATPLFGALLLLGLTGAARMLQNESAGYSAPLLAIGTLGLLQPLHEAQPAVAGLACAAMAYWGAGLIINNRAYGAWMIGSGIGFSFLADGLSGILISVVPLLAPLLRRDWKSFGRALVIALPLMAFWPLLLANYAPALLTEWWKYEIADATLGRSMPDIGHLAQLSWAAWPILPVAIWSLWLHRREPTRLALPLTGTLLGLLWYLSGPNRPLSVLPVLLPMTLVAASGVDRLRRGAANAFDWFSLTTFTFAAGLLWLGASAQALDWPPRIARNFDKLAPGHLAHYSLQALGFAVAITLAWLLSWRISRTSWRPTLRWAAGMTLMWALAAVFWLSWLDHAKSFRQPVMSLKAALPPDVDCIERVAVSTAQRASLDYFAGIRTVPATRTTPSRCSWRLSTNDRNRKLPDGWVEYWHGQRPSDRDERWYLDRRKSVKAKGALATQDENLSPPSE